MELDEQCALAFPHRCNEVDLPGLSAPGVGTSVFGVVGVIVFSI
jgi:hypothetical protein